MAATRKDKLTYTPADGSGAFVVGQGTNYQFHGNMVLQEDAGALSVSVVVIVAQTSSAQFLTDCQNLEAAFRKPNGNLKIEIDSGTHKDLTFAADTGFLATPTISKIGSSADSTHTRLYQIQIRIELPAFETGKITYAGTAIGDGTSYALRGVYTQDKSYSELTVRAFVIVQNTTAATFVTDCTALEAAFRTPNGALKVEIGGGTVYDLSHSGNTGFLARPAIRKVGLTTETDNTRLYEVSVTVQLPADETGKNARSSGQVVFSTDGAGLVRLDVSAVYTASGANGSLAQAKANFVTWAASHQATEGGTWDELDAVQYRADDEDKFCSASISYIQVIANQSVGSLNDTTLQGVRIFANSVEDSAGSHVGGGAKPLRTVSVGMSCRVRKSVSTDLKGIYETKVRPRLIEVAEALSGVSPLTVVQQDPGLDPTTNTINARMTLTGGTFSLISLAVITSQLEDAPWRFEPVLNGDPWAVDKHFTPARGVAAVFAQVVEFAGGVTDRSLSAFFTAIEILESAGYHHRTTEVQADQSWVELDGQGVSSPLRIRDRRIRAVLVRGNISVAPGAAIASTLERGGERPELLRSE